MKSPIIKSFADYLEQVCSTTFNGHLFRGVPDAAAHKLFPSIGRLAKFAINRSATFASVRSSRVA
jgi:hypothetical protein